MHVCAAKISQVLGKARSKKANLPQSGGSVAWWLGGLVGRLAAPLLH